MANVFKSAVPDLNDVWRYLRGLPTLGDIAELHRGIAWNKPPLREDSEETGCRGDLVQDTWFPGSHIGVPPKADLFAFETPRPRYLDMSTKHLRGATHNHAWDIPKVILSSVRKTRGAWRTAAFIDTEGWVCYQDCTAVWPDEPANLIAIASVLNGPLANAYLSGRAATQHVTIRDLGTMPVPEFSHTLLTRLDELIREYRHLTGRPIDATSISPEAAADAEAVLKLIDATALEAYDLPPRLERELLEYFRGADRPVPFTFGEYFPKSFESCFSLSDYLSNDFANGSAGEFLKRYSRQRELSHKPHNGDGGQ